MSPAETAFISGIRESRYLLAAVLLASLWTAEWLAPMYAGRRNRLRHGGTNLALALVNGGVAYAGALGILLATEFSRAHQFGLLHRLEAGEPWRWGLAILLFDCWQYWWHRINHEIGVLWRFHSVHHSDRELDATSGVRFHAVEIAFSIAARAAVLPLIGMTIPQLVLYEAVSLPVILFHHSNIRLPGRVDRRLRWLIVTPWMHWVHHSRIPAETNSNYSSLLSVWDRLFGSFRLRADPGAIKLGLDGWRGREWRSFGGLLATPFRKR